MIKETFRKCKLGILHPEINFYANGEKAVIAIFQWRKTALELRNTVYRLEYIVVATGLMYYQNIRNIIYCVISGFRRGVNEIYALLGLYAA